MESSQKTSAKAGGFILAVAIIAGAVGGTIVGQPSAGFVVGTAAGILVAVLIWLNDRTREA